MNLTELAVSRFRQGFMCSQAITSTFAPQVGLPADLAMKIAAPFGGGMGRTGGTCGAVSGAYIILGLAYGYTDVEDKAAKENMYALVRDFSGRFQALRASTICDELLGFDIGSSEGLQKAREAGVFTTRCPELVRDSAALLCEFLHLDPAGL